VSLKKQVQKQACSQTLLGCEGEGVSTPSLGHKATLHQPS